METVIIGNGILALTTAYRMAVRADKADRITIVGKKSRPLSATMAAAAMLNSFAEIEAGSLETDIDLFRFELSHMATRVWPKFVIDYMDVARDFLPDGCKNCQGSKGACFELGTYLINNNSSDSLDDENFKAVKHALKEFDESHWEVDPKDIPSYDPYEKSRAQQAIYIPNEGWLNPVLTLEAIESTLMPFKNVRYVEDEVQTLVRKGDKIDHVVLTSGDTVAGDNFLLASGATASDIIDRSKIDISIPRIFYGVGVSILLRSPEAQLRKVIRTPNRGLACGLYIVPFYETHRLPFDKFILGASNYISPVPLSQARAGSVQNMLNGAIEQFNKSFFRATIERVNVGCRPTPADGYPVIGRTGIHNLIVATGTKRDGFHLSPIISEALTHLLHDEPIDPRYEMFSPQRKLVRNWTREKAISTGVRHLVSAAYQHGYNPPHSAMGESVKKMFKEDLERLHDQVGAKDWGIPPEMFEMYRYGHVKP